MTPWDLPAPALPSHGAKPIASGPQPEYVPVVLGKKTDDQGKEELQYALYKAPVLGWDIWHRPSPFKFFSGPWNRFFMPLGGGQMLAFRLPAGIPYDDNSVSPYLVVCYVPTLHYTVFAPVWPRQVRRQSLYDSDFTQSVDCPPVDLGQINKSDTSLVLKPLFAGVGVAFAGVLRYRYVYPYAIHPYAYAGLFELRMGPGETAPTVTFHAPTTTTTTLRPAVPATSILRIAGKSLQYEVEGWYKVYTVSLSVEVTPGDPGATKTETVYPLCRADGTLLFLRHVTVVDKSTTLTVDFSSSVTAAMEYTPGAWSAAGGFNPPDPNTYMNVITWDTYHDQRHYVGKIITTHTLTLESEDGSALQPPLEIKSENTLVLDSVADSSGWSAEAWDSHNDGDTWGGFTAASPVRYGYGVTTNWDSSYEDTMSAPAHPGDSKQASGVVSNWGSGDPIGDYAPISSNLKIKSPVLPTPDGVLIDVAIGTDVVRLMLTPRGLKWSRPTLFRNTEWSEIDFDLYNRPLDEQSVWRITYNPVTGEFYDRAMDLR